MNHFTPIETTYLEKSGRKGRYPGEHLTVIETPDPVALGKLTAARFIEWCEQNPHGVISLPTGKTPEFFIRDLKRIKQEWGDERFYALFEGLTFVQLDELFPVPAHALYSFTYFIRTYYVPLLGLKEHQLCLMDLTAYFLHSEFLSIQGFCDQFEATIVRLTQEEKRPWFILGGIGEQDGHFAFNMPDTPLTQKTHLALLDYPTRAITSVGFGGIANVTPEAMTIGLGTMIDGATVHPNSIAILFAAGETKAPIIAKVIEEPVSAIPDLPAKFLQKIPTSRVYLVENAASRLHARISERILVSQHLPSIQRVLIDRALELNKSVLFLKAVDLAGFMTGDAVLKAVPSLPDILLSLDEDLKSCVRNGLSLLNTKGTWLETGPHHDDPELSHSALYRALDLDTHAFAFTTSGFTSVSRVFMMTHLAKITDDWLTRHLPLILSSGKHALFTDFQQAFDTENTHRMDDLETVLFVYALCQTHEITSPDDLRTKLLYYKTDYFPSHLPGTRDIQIVQLWKGMIRELESERLLFIVGVDPTIVHQLRSRYYQGKVFNSQPGDDDIADIFNLLIKYRPSCLTVTFDPEGSGPDTHFKTLQSIVAAIRQYSDDLDIISYRNVWSFFHPGEVNCMIPVLESEMILADALFKACHKTQVYAEFPSPTFDGPFSDQCMILQSQQLHALKTLIGPDFFAQSDMPRLRDAKGLIFLNREAKAAFLERVSNVSLRVVGDAALSASF